jgi:hypothetical protein
MKQATADNQRGQKVSSNSADVGDAQPILRVALTSGKDRQHKSNHQAESKTHEQTQQPVVMGESQVESRGHERDGP